MEKRLWARRIMTVLILFALVSPFLIGPTPVAAQATEKIILFDYSHGQYKGSVYEAEDKELKENLTEMGFTIVDAWGGINDTILSDAVGLVIGSLYGSANKFLTSEINAIKDWFDSGNKFLWVAYDSDYSGAYINDNMTLILEAVGSHVYGEPTSIEDPVSNCGAGYRPVANETSDDSFVADIVKDVDAVLMHGPTLLYGSDSANPGENVNPVALETDSIANVYPLLYYGGNATIVDHDTIYPYAHSDNQKGEFVAATIEINAGAVKTSVLVVSGASPYGDYMPMSAWEYKGVALNGYRLVLQTIEFGVNYALNPPAGFDITLILAGVGVVVVIIIIVAVLKKK